MSLLNRLLIFTAALTSTFIIADDCQLVLHHIGAENEEVSEEGVAYQRQTERKPWYYHHQDYSDLDPREGVDYALEDETEWPSQRETYSDYLMRDKPRDW